ncbi:CAP domain-containing protein [Streptomyces hiroshimensis]|uniref:Membrane protein n=1 Tax=Streptomyces hiroshimensis TaxID=66424 RepID=A0ABQ2YDY9_9ACTN|nr:CAP domain-containing protein [Streptomyces hiroshimensis]GGX80805.1 membrane protein [Streptomyces hiroshimensis]
MGRHRRSAPRTAGSPVPAPPQAGRTSGASAPGHSDDPGAPAGEWPPDPRRPRARPKTPVRTGLLGASAAMAMGVVAMTSGLFSGGGTLQLGNDGHGGGQVRTDEPPVTEFTRPDARPSGRGQSHVSRNAERPPAPRADTAVPVGAASEPSAPSAAPSDAPPGPEGAGTDPGGAPGDGPDGASGDAQRADSPGRESAAPAPRARADAQAGGETRVAGQVQPAGQEQTADQAALYPSVARQLLSLVNQERAKAGLRPLKASTRLAGLAQAFSDDMARRGFFNHTDPDGRSPWDRAARYGIRNLGGENIARGHPDAHAVMDAWMHSAGHRANILNRDYRTLGIGLNTSASGPWWTQDFGY